MADTAFWAESGAQAWPVARFPGRAPRDANSVVVVIFAPPQVSPARDGRVPALDLLRGLAALLMVFNHVGFAVLAQPAATTGISGAIVLVSSCAPVLFFFCTGFGVGLGTRPVPWASTWNKALLLTVADQFLAWSQGRVWTLDFFGFIALSMVAARLVMATPRPVLFAAVGSVALLVLRYGFGHTLDAQLDGFAVFRWTLGVTALEGVSYPAAPWLTYPLLGVAMGVAYRRHAASVPRIVGACLALVILASAGAAALVVERGGSLHRWGSVSFAFFALSLAILGTALVLSHLLATRLPRTAGVLSLSGVASFAVVPVHYVFVRTGLLAPQIDLAIYVGLASLIVVASFVAARAFERGATAILNAPRGGGPAVAGAVVVVMVAAACVTTVHAAWPIAAQLAATAGQLAIGVLFAARPGLLAAHARAMT